MDERSFLGTGWSFPPQFSKESVEVKMLSDVADIESSLQVLLTTRPGERVMQPHYGCNLDELVFEPLTSTFKSYIKDLVKTAIINYEPRIKVEGVELDDTRELEGVILIEIAYEVRTTNTRYNFVYPFYKVEGTEIR